MILGPVSLVDCLVAGLLVGPLLLWNAGFLATLTVFVKGLPFIGMTYVLTVNTASQRQLTVFI